MGSIEEINKKLQDGNYKARGSVQEEPDFDSGILEINISERMRYMKE